MHEWQADHDHKAAATCIAIFFMLDEISLKL